ncbi:MAG: spinster family MFS transporter [Hyphomonas sp.]
MSDQTQVNAARAQSNGGVYAWYVVGILMLAQTFSFIDRMIMGLMVGPIRTSFDISDTQYSLLAGLAFAIFYSVMGLPLARIADRYSRRSLIAIAITVWSLMTALCGMAQGFWALFAARVGVGVGEAALSPAAYSLITDYFPRKSLARALSVYTIGVTIGSGLAYIIGGKVIEYTMSLGEVVLPVIGEREGWQLAFFVVGLPGLIVAALMFTFREPVRKGGMKTAAAQAGADVDAPSIGEVVSFLMQRKRAFLTHILGLSLFIMVVFSLNIWGPEYFIRTFGYTRGEAGLTFGLIMMVMGTAGLLMGGILADRWFSQGQTDAYSRVILMSMLAMLPFLVVIGLTELPLVGMVCLSVAIFLSAFQGGVGGGVIQLITPNEMRGQATAVYFLVANLLGMGFGPTIVASITDYVFRDDGALNKSIALAGVILIPIAAAIILSGLRSVREAIIEAKQWSE